MAKNYGPIKFGLISGMTMVIVLLITGTIFAVWNDISKVNSNDTLNSTEWNNMVDDLDYLKNGVVIPEGLISAFGTTTCPSGWLPADGINGTPDLRGVFIRGANSFDNGVSYNNRDVDRATSGSGVLSEQGDAIRNITGEAFGRTGLYLNGSSNTPKGAFYANSPGEDNQGIPNTNYKSGNIGFDASLQVPTGSDNRPQNIALIYCIKE